MAIIANIYLDEHSSGGGFTRWADVYINLFDSSTYLPVNGDNVVVNYQLTEFFDGFEHYSNHSATIAGQSQLIDPGVPTFVSGYDEFGNLTATYYRSYLVISVSDAPDPSPPVNTCDLQISNIQVDKLETSPGASDAQISVYAISSYLPIQYSLDNINFQSSNIFTGITGGIKTVYVTDANTVGCAVNQTVTVRTLNSLLVKDPSVTIGGNISRWNAAFNPVVFTYQRQDFEVYGISLDSATNKAKLLINSPTDKLNNGDKVYVNAGDYKGVFDVKSGSANNTLVIDAPFTTTATGFININKLRPYYAIKTKITYQDKLNGQQKTIESTNRPDNTGLVKADISNFLQSLVSAKDDSNFTKTNFRDSNLSASYRISFAQQWDDENGQEQISAYTEIADTFFVTYAAKQIGQRYGGNLAAYVPFKTLTGGAQPAALITDFAEPAYSNGYPFDIGFIYSEDLLGLQLYCELTLLDINRNPLSGATETIELLNEDGSWLLNQDGSKYVIANQTISNTPLAQQLGLNRLLINNNFTNDAHYFTLSIYCDTTSIAQFSYELSEATSPVFIDGNGQLKVNGVTVADLYSNGADTHSLYAGDAYSFEAIVNENSAAANPKLRLTVTKNGGVIFDKRIPAVAGASLLKTGIAQPGAIYHATVSTTDTTEIITPIDIPDDSLVTAGYIQIFRDQVVRIDKNHDDNSVYLRWIGLSGSWNYYRFVYNQEISLDVQNATIIKNHVTDWEHQESIEEVISKSAGQKMKVMAEDLSVNDIKGLQSIKYSPKVQMLVNKNPVKWQTVVLNTATFNEYETRNGQAPFSVTFNLPSINIQSQ
jgi:hypothetical protein